MNDDGPRKSPFDGKTTEQILSTLSTRSDHWFNLAQAFPRLYTEGFDRSTLEELAGVPPARQEVWVTAANVYATLRVRMPCCCLLASPGDLSSVADRVRLGP